ncbi:MAG: sulfotransferase family 2 domain-containing protein [Bauldia sp.]|uniref:sulfotransferase family 2 domain-containing protein n=1 Tax=Bauldia sp. TaxID=2575872 RepID=UPI001D75A894|nr:sulfotransferase family 2 domain-containing protein [Bauldia sp.]MCB1495591.1 sulfotransferase family 2 domain-containing protein [Bauldia sp.]
MIISHKHRFIFLKTEKTASTSLQMALANACGPDDIIIGARRDPVTNKPRGKKPSLGIGRYVSVPAEIRRRMPWAAGFYPHMTARQVRKVVGREVWNGYFKFAVERNPWDRQVSNYFHRQRRRAEKKDFERYLSDPIYRGLHHVRLNNWRIYTIDDEIAVDAMIRYEDLQGGYRKVQRNLGLTGDVTLPRRRSTHRGDDGGYRRYYSRRTAGLVAGWYAREIDAFGYEF